MLVLAVLQLGRLELARHIVTIVIAGVALWYLTTPRVRAAFGRSQAKDGGILQRATDKRPPNDFGAAFSADPPRDGSRPVRSRTRSQAGLVLVRDASSLAILSSSSLMAWSCSSRCAWICSDSWNVASASW